MDLSDELHQAIEDSVKAMQIELWAPLTASECDLVKRALAPAGTPLEVQQEAS